MWGVGVVGSVCRECEGVGCVEVCRECGVWWEYVCRECEGGGMWKCVCVYRSMSMKVCREVCVDVRVWGV